MESKYNVYKIRVDDFKAVQVLASNVSQETVARFESMVMTEPLDFFVSGYEVGSPRDNECADDLS